MTALFVVIGMSFAILILGSALAYHLDNPSDAYYGGDYEGPCTGESCIYDNADICIDCGWSREDAYEFNANPDDYVGRDLI